MASAPLADAWPADGPPRLWSRELGEGYSAIVAQRDLLVTMYREGGNEVVVALDAGSGTTRWQFSYDAPLLHDGYFDVWLNGAGPGPDDFRRAVEQWEAALDIDPNNYIWRRRIQQYGPRLTKPYPFYDWVPTARTAIEARGDVPAPLRVEPGGAEFAAPTDTFVTGEETPPEPDPGNRIYQDPSEFILVEALTVPTGITAGSSTRAHLTFRPNVQRKAHWNNEADDMVFWVNPPDGWEVDVRHVTVERPPQLVSLEPRRVEFEIRSPKTATEGGVVVPGYALYYVCEDVDGTCLYRRQDVAIELEVRDAR